VTSVYCYDYADRIQKVAKSSGTNPYAGGFVYDAHGNTTTVGTDIMSYDGANRHLKTVNGSTTIEYTRDAADRIITRTVGGTTISKQAYTGAGDTSDLTLDGSGNLTEITISLAGGGLYTWRPSTAEVWSFANTHGDLTVTCNSSGTQTGTTGSYDPFGNPLGSTAIDNSTGNLDYGWHGQAQRPLEHETGVIATIEMGARPYQPALGRFLAIDPIEGGTPNDYTYVTEPIDTADLDGRKCRGTRTQVQRCAQSKSAIGRRYTKCDGDAGCVFKSFTPTELGTIRERVRSGGFQSYGLNWTNDGCSGPGMRSSFTIACQRHDFGYRNWSGLYSDKISAKNLADYTFYADLRSICGAAAGIDATVCWKQAAAAYRAVRSFGDPNEGEG
jgi:RHS repeat-associated protein